MKMVEKQESKNIEGNVKFDIIVNGECERRVSGLLAYEDTERDGFALLGRYSHSFAVKIILALIKNLVDNKAHTALLMLMVELDGIFDVSKEK